MESLVKQPTRVNEETGRFTRYLLLFCVCLITYNIKVATSWINRYSRVDIAPT